MAIHFFGECLFDFKLKRQEARDTRFFENDWQGTR